MKRIFFFVTAFGLSIVLGLALGSAQAQEKLPTEIKNCLIEKLGESAFNEIISGSRAPTDEEKEKGAPCFEKKPLIKKKPTVNLPSTVRECIKQILGKYPEEITEEPSEELKAKIDSQCFASQEKHKGVPSVIKFPRETMECIKNLLGADKFERLLEGKYEPTYDEKAKIGPACFNMPPPPSEEEIKQLSTEERQCIERILGHPINSFAGGPPTKEQMRRIGEECFGGRGPGEGPGQGPEGQEAHMPNFPEEVMQCIEKGLGFPLSQIRGKPTAEQEKIITQCNEEYEKKHRSQSQATEQNQQQNESNNQEQNQGEEQQ